MNKILLCFALLTLTFTGCSPSPSMAAALYSEQPSSIPLVETSLPSLIPPTQIPKNPQTATPEVAPPTPTPFSPRVDLSAPALLPLTENHKIGPEVYPPGVNPLTGLPVANPDLLNRHPLAIKVTNYPRFVRPQAGLNLADVVYDYYMERGITRFIAVYYGNNAERVGPVRSGRFFDEHIFTMYASYFVFGNADYRIRERYFELGREVINRFVLERPEDAKHTCKPSGYFPLCRDKSILSYNNMFANTAAISERDSSEQPPDLTGMLFSDRPPVGGQTALTLDFNYSIFTYSRWIYDPPSGKYMRWEETHEDNSLYERKDYAPLFDSLTNRQVAADNVAALFVEHTYHTNTPTTEIVQIQLNPGIGQAILFREGKSYPGYWVRPSDGGVLYLMGKDGKPLPYKPGNTFYQVLGVTSQLTQNQGDWTFDFAIP